MFRRRALVGFAVAVPVAFAFFCGSVVLFGSWWRFRDMPTPEEWSAFFGAFALLALAFGWYQIRLVDQSNRELIASNEEARRLTLEQIRPRVRAYLDVERSATKRRGEPARGTIYVAVTNFGPTPASNVTLQVDTPFVSLDKFFNPGRMADHLAKMNSIFDGSVHFHTLLPDKTYVWFLGRAPDLMEDVTLATRRYRIKVAYDGQNLGRRFEDSFLIDLDVERDLSQPVAPLDRIGKDLEVIGEKIDKVASKR